MIVVRPIDHWRFPPESTRLDSARGTSSPYSRWSYRLGPASRVLRCQRPQAGVTLSGSDGIIGRWDQPLDALHWLGSELPAEADPAGPPFKGGWVGFLGYDVGRLFEPMPALAADDLGTPLFEFRFHQSLDACDEAGRFFAIDPAGAPDRSLHHPDPIPLDQTSLAAAAPLLSTFSRPAYLAAVERVLQLIRAGDVFQVNLSQRFTTPLGARRPFDIYSALIQSHAARYGAYLPSDDYAVLSNSPELFLRVEPGKRERKVVTRPIKGTRPLQPGSRELLEASAKDQAELNMIVDLERNDLGRVCEIGSVRVSEPRVIEAHSTVYHGAATVEGLLRRDVSWVDLLRAAFPGGSVTGAPKIRAMQIIEELEPVRRGPYCGAIGYLSVDGHIELNVAIRTMLVERGKVHISVGGGIVADSEAEAEYDETLVKARGMFAALGIRSG